MQVELEALKTNQTCDVVPCPQNVKPIDGKWVYLVELYSNGFLELYKARLVTLGSR